MLEAITDEGQLHWNCHTDGCPPRACHLSHQAVEWVAPDLVALPFCPSCGSRTFIKTKFSAQELAPPLIEREISGTIRSVQLQGAANFTLIEHQVERHLVPHPDRPGELLEAFSFSITDIRPSPVVARHQKLHTLLHEHGKPAPVS